MQKGRGKIISLLLVMVLILQLVPATVRADDGKDKDTSQIIIDDSESEDLNYTPYPDAASVQNPNSGMTWDEYFGGVANMGFPMSKMPLVSLENGLADYDAHGGYTSATPSLMRYIGTPFSWSVSSDSVHPGPGGKLNCTAFFVWLVRNMGVSQADYVSKTGGSYAGGVYSLRRVTDQFRSMAKSGRIIMYNFPSFEAAQASGKLKKGDIMIMEPADGNSHDHHFTVYWGDTPNQNIVQHSIDSSDCVLYRGGVKTGNIISNLPVGSWGRRVWVFPNSVFEFYISLEKEPGAPAITDGSEFTIKNVRENETLCVAVVDQNGNVKSIKNKENDDDFQIDLVTMNGKKYIRVMEHEAGSRIYGDTTAMKITVRQSSSPSGNIAGTESSTIIVGNGLDKAKNIYIKEDIDYSAVYDYNFYINKYADLKKAFGNNKTAALNHFVTHGMKEGRQGSASFNVNSYRNRYSDLRVAFRTDLTKYYQHYIKYGKAEGRIATGDVKLTPITKLNGVDYSAVYDYNYYINKYPDLRKAFGNDDVGALEHFIKNGMREGRQAKATFNLSAYKTNYVDLQKAYGSNNAAYYNHYIKYGVKEKRNAASTTIYQGVDYKLVFDATYYANKYPDLKKAFGTDALQLFNHFIKYGMKEGRQASEEFNFEAYKQRYKDLQKAYGNNNALYYQHYIRFGKSEGRNARTGN